MSCSTFDNEDCMENELEGKWSNPSQIGGFELYPDCG